MNDERLDNIQKCLTIFNEVKSSGILDLVSEIRTLRKLVRAIDIDYGGNIFCRDVDGKNWFDFRDEILNGD